MLSVDSDEEEVLLLLVLSEDCEDKYPINRTNEEDNFGEKNCDILIDEESNENSPTTYSEDDQEFNSKERIEEKLTKKDTLKHNVESASKKGKKRKWINEINLTREDDGEFQRIFKELVSSEEKFFNYFHMSKCAFEELHGLVKKSIMKANTNWRQSISSKERLAIFLKYLATGDCYRSIATSFRVGNSTVSSIVKDVSIAICHNLEEKYMPLPTAELWKASETGYRELWNFPNCIGCIDGKIVHVKVKFLNEKQNDNDPSVVLIAVVDPFCKFTVADVGNYGDSTDIDAFENSRFYRQYLSRKLLLPPKPLPGSDIPTPHVLLGDKRFPLLPYLMKNYSKNESVKHENKNNFNLRLDNARTVVKRAFDILTTQWKVLNRPIESKVAIDVVRAACLLYNYVRIKDENSFEIDTNERKKNKFSHTASRSHRSPKEALEVRERFAAYFSENSIKES